MGKTKKNKQPGSTQNNGSGPFHRQQQSFQNPRQNYNFHCYTSNPNPPLNFNRSNNYNNGAPQPWQNPQGNQQGLHGPFNYNQPQQNFNYNDNWYYDDSHHQQEYYGNGGGYGGYNSNNRFYPGRRDWAPHPSRSNFPRQPPPPKAKPPKQSRKNRAVSFVQQKQKNPEELRQIRKELQTEIDDARQEIQRKTKIQEKVNELKEKLKNKERTASSSSLNPTESQEESSSNDQQSASSKNQQENELHREVILTTR